MELLLSDQQELLADSAARLVERTGGPERIRRAREGGGQFDGGIWREVAGAGWLAVLVPQDQGGAGLGLTELALFLEQAGRRLMPEPVGAAAAARAVAASEQSALCASLLAGERIVLPALQETPLAVDPGNPATTASEEGDGVRLRGGKILIPEAQAADGFLINACTASGALLCYVPRDAVSLSSPAGGRVDGGAWGDLKLADVMVPAAHILASGERAAGLVQCLLDDLLIATSAELLGVMGQALDMTLEYLRTRQQFGQPIGGFQALQHHAVDRFVDVELTRSLLHEICKAVDQGRDSPALAAALKAKASETALAVAKSAIQLHGAVAYADEHDAGLYLKRAMALAASHGNAAGQHARYARLTGIAPQ
jgi:alkylation response protein AidB-like acyl-CoA dehydrogenase